MSKLEELSNIELQNKINEIRNDVEYLGEKLFRKQQYRSALLREMYKRHLTIVNGELVEFVPKKQGIDPYNGNMLTIPFEE